MEADSHVVQGRGYRQRIKAGCQRKYLGSGQHLKERDRTGKKKEKRKGKLYFLCEGAYPTEPSNVFRKHCPRRLES